MPAPPPLPSSQVPPCSPQGSRTPQPGQGLVLTPSGGFLTPPPPRPAPPPTASLEHFDLNPSALCACAAGRTCRVTVRLARPHGREVSPRTVLGLCAQNRPGSNRPLTLTAVRAGPARWCDCRRRQSERSRGLDGISGRGGDATGCACLGGGRGLCAQAEGQSKGLRVGESTHTGTRGRCHRDLWGHLNVDTEWGL